MRRSICSLLAVVASTTIVLVLSAPTHAQKDNPPTSAAAQTNQPGNPELSAKATEILKNRCVQCHNGTRKFSVLDTESMIRRGRIVPGNAAKSKLYRTVSRGSHPSKRDGGPCTADEVKVIGDWINSMAAKDAGAASQPAK